MIDEELREIFEQVEERCKQHLKLCDDKAEYREMVRVCAEKIKESSMSNKKVRVEARVDPELKAAVEEVLNDKYHEMSMTEYLTECLEFTKQFKEVPDGEKYQWLFDDYRALRELMDSRLNMINDLSKELADLKSKQRGGWFDSAKSMCSWLGGK